MVPPQLLPLAKLYLATFRALVPIRCQTVRVEYPWNLSCFPGTAPNRSILFIMSIAGRGHRYTHTHTPHSPFSSPPSTPSHSSAPKKRFYSPASSTTHRSNVASPPSLHACWVGAIMWGNRWTQVKQKILRNLTPDSALAMTPQARLLR